MDSILEATAITKSFGGIHAVQNVSFAVQRETIHAVIGPNGAGKTTLFNLLSGAIKPDSGTIKFNGKEITGYPPHAVAATGINRTFQNIKIAATMSVFDNIALGTHTLHCSGFIKSLLCAPSVKKEERIAREKVEAIASQLGITPILYKTAGSLSYGERRKMELARALVANPALLLLDEPAAGLNMKETEELSDYVKEIRAGGITILIVEHDMGLVMGISDKVTVLAQGKKIAEGGAREVQKDELVIRQYLGEDEC